MLIHYSGMPKLTLEDYNELVLLIYQAGANPDLWPDFIRKLDSILDCAHLTIYGHDLQTGLSLGELTSRFEEAALKEYRAHFHKVNPFPEIMMGMPVGEIRASYDMVDRDSFLSSEFYNDFLRTQDNVGGGGGGVLLNGEGRLLIVAGHVPMKDDDEKTPYLVENLRLLAPHLSQAFGMQRALQGVRVQNDMLKQSLDQVDRLVFLLGQIGEIIFANRAARAELDEQAWLSQSRQGSLVFRDEHANTMLGKALHDRVFGAAETGAMSFPVHAKHQGKAVGAVYPLDLDVLEIITDQDPAPFRSEDNTSVSMLIVSGHRMSDRHTEKLLQEAFDLTPAEQAVALAIAGGDSLREFSDSRNISINTAKTQLRSVFEKTGSSRQNQLAVLVQGLK